MSWSLPPQRPPFARMLRRKKVRALTDCCWLSGRLCSPHLTPGTGDGLGTLRPFRVETKEEMLQNAVFAYEIVSNQAVSAGEDAILRPAHFHR